MKALGALLKFIFGLIFLILIAGGIFLYLNFGDLSKRAVEKVATNALNVPVSISKLDLSLKEKSVTVSGIRIANPKGYAKPYAVQVGRVSIALAEVPENFDLIKFKSINVSDTIVNLEVNEKTTNLSQLKRGMPKKPVTAKSSTTKVIVSKFHINQSTLNPAVTLIGGDLGTVKVPPVTLSGIGQRENGVLAEEAIQQILNQYLNIAVKEANQAGYLKGLVDVDKIKNRVKDKIEGKLKNLGIF